jgi:hypothetical protein
LSGRIGARTNPLINAIFSEIIITTAKRGAFLPHVPHHIHPTQPLCADFGD